MIRHPALDLPGLAHGFFGREGGVSTGDFASLNLSDRTGDDPALVARNRARVAGALGLDGIVTLTQVHSSRVLTLTGAPAPGTEADAIVTAVAGLGLGILTADCAPILFADPEACVIGAAHAGWQGAALGIAAATVGAMVGLGAHPARIRAVIGPAISGPSYEIGPETAARILARAPAAASRIAVPPGGSREHFDIPGLLGDQLAQAGVGTVADLALCTYAAPGRFFSHRYATHHGIRTGRQVSVIALL